ncbi:hypothetical protein IGI72_000025 [Enterococcus sp. DIV1059_2]
MHLGVALAQVKDEASGRYPLEGSAELRTKVGPRKKASFE